MFVQTWIEHSLSCLKGGGRGDDIRHSRSRRGRRDLSSAGRYVAKRHRIPPSFRLRRKSTFARRETAPLLSASQTFSPATGGNRPLGKGGLLGFKIMFLTHFPVSRDGTKSGDFYHRKRVYFYEKSE